MSQRFVNGPINAIRLEGNVAGIDKVIYLFMDRHDAIYEQTKCTNVFAKDISQYFLDMMFQTKETGLTYDFFVETTVTNINTTKARQRKYERKQIYINDTEDMFAKLIQYDPKTNKISYEKELAHIRLHFMDIRDHFEWVAYVIFDAIREQIKKKNYQAARTQVSKLLSIMRLLVDILKKPVKRKAVVLQEPQKNVLKPDVLNYLAYKMRHSYTHKEIKDHMNALMDDIVTTAETAIGLVQRLDNDLGEAKYRGLDTIENLIFNIFFVRLTDIFFLRRVLDKNYITHVITYTGWSHSDFYANILVRDYGFTITHSTMSRISLELANNMAARKGFGFLIDVPGQCVDISHFPENFL